MKGIAVTLLLLLVLAASGLAQVPDDKLIVPGQRIGKWTLDMTVDDLDRMNGQGSQARTTEPGFQPGFSLRGWPEFGLLAGYREGQARVEYLSLSILVSTSGISSFKTREGIGISSKWEEVFSAYRWPSWQTRLTQGVTRAVYDQMGIAFLRLLNSEGVDTVVALYVFRPGTARSIWR